MSKKFTVSMAVDGRVDVTVDADTPQEAFEKAKLEFIDADLANMTVVDARPVNAYDEETGILTDK